MTSRIPAIVCGKTPDMARRVVASLKPEVDVIHVVLGTEQGAAELPVLLRGEKLPAETTAENIGSQNYTEPPKLVLVGGGYDDALFSELRKPCEGVSKVPWMRHDWSIDVPLDPPSYGAAIVKRMKAKVAELEAEGKFGEDAVFGY